VVKALLAMNIIASTSPYAPSHVRLAGSLLNPTDEVDAAVRAVQEIALSPAGAR
jgi:hypothetical protein